MVTTHFEGVTYVLNENTVFAKTRFDKDWFEGAPCREGLETALFTYNRESFWRVCCWDNHPLTKRLYMSEDGKYITKEEVKEFIDYCVSRGWLICPKFDESLLWD